MALTASLSLNMTTATVNQQINGSLTISNSGGSPVSVSQLLPHARKTGSSLQDLNTGVAVTGPQLGPNYPNSVPAGGSLVFPLSYTFFSPSSSLAGTGYADGTFDCRCLCYGADGSVFSPTAAMVTVNPIPQPTLEL